MSDQISSDAEDTLDELALRYALDTLTEGERVQFESCLNCPHSQAAVLAEVYRDAVATFIAATLPACPPPPPELKARVFDAIRKGDRPPLPSAPAPGLTFIGRDDHPWMPTPYRGVRLRELPSTSPDFSILMLSLEAGSVYPSHDHRGAEDIYILTGEARMDNQPLRAGDFMHWEPGSRHHDMTSSGGCEAMIITSSKNYSSRLIHSYDFAHRVVARVGRALGIKGSE